MIEILPNNYYQIRYQYDYKQPYVDIIYCKSVNKYFLEGDSLRYQIDKNNHLLKLDYKDTSIHFDFITEVVFIGNENEEDKAITLFKKLQKRKKVKLVGNIYFPGYNYQFYPGNFYKITLKNNKVLVAFFDSFASLGGYDIWWECTLFQLYYGLSEDCKISLKEAKLVVNLKDIKEVTFICRENEKDKAIALYEQLRQDKIVL